MELRKILARLAALRSAEGFQPFTQGANVVGDRFHLAHPQGPVLEDLKTIADQSPALLAELDKALAKVQSK